MAQVNKEFIASVNPNVDTTTTKIRDFLKINPLEFHVSKVHVDPQEFIDEVYNIFKSWEFVWWIRWNCPLMN